LFFFSNQGPLKIIFLKNSFKFFEFWRFYFLSGKRLEKINFDSVNRVERASQLFCEEGKRTNNNNKVVVHLGVG
jgi:hypothetical protein